jgi:carbamoyl-phosphate synthase small subunit
MLGKIVLDQDIPFHDPNTENLVAQVSIGDVVREGEGETTIVLIDCGVKRNCTLSACEKCVCCQRALGLRSLLA